MLVALALGSSSTHFHFSCLPVAFADSLPPPHCLETFTRIREVSVLGANRDTTCWHWSPLPLTLTQSLTFIQCNYPSDLPGNNWSVLVHLPTPFLLSPGIFWSYSPAPTIPGSLPSSVKSLSSVARTPAQKWQPSLANSAQLSKAVGLARSLC